MEHNTSAFSAALTEEKIEILSSLNQQLTFYLAIKIGILTYTVCFIPSEYSLWTAETWHSGF